MKRKFEGPPHAITTQLMVGPVEIQPTANNDTSRVVIHHLGSNAYDRPSCKVITDFINTRKTSRTKALLDYLLKTGQFFDTYEAIIYYGKGPTQYRQTVEEAYADAVDAGDTAPTFLRIWKKEGFRNYICAPETCYFGNVDTNLYDADGQVKQDIKDQVIQSIKAELLLDDPIFDAKTTFKLLNDKMTEEDRKARILIEMFFGIYRERGSEVLKAVIEKSGQTAEEYQVFVYLDINRMLFVQSLELALAEAIKRHNRVPNFIWLNKHDNVVSISATVKVPLWDIGEDTVWLDQDGVIKKEMQVRSIEQIKSRLTMLSL